MIRQLTGTALVTGASSGIGRETAMLLAEAGHDLALVSRNEQILGELRDELVLAHNIAVTVIPADLSQAGAAQMVYDECRSRGIVIDILIANAGIGHYGEILHMDMCRISSLIALNVTALTELCRLFGADMRERGRGWILTVSSVVARAPVPCFAVYAATKSYVTSFSRALGEELRSQGIVVTCLHPGQTATGFFDAAGGRQVKEHMLMDPREVARIGLKALQTGRHDVTAGVMNKAFGILMPYIPTKIIGNAMRKMIRESKSGG